MLRQFLALLFVFSLGFACGHQFGLHESLVEPAIDAPTAVADTPSSVLATSRPPAPQPTANRVAPKESLPKERLGANRDRSAPASQDAAPASPPAGRERTRGAGRLLPQSVPWVGQEVRLQRLRRERDIEDFLKDTQTPNLGSIVPMALPFELPAKTAPGAATSPAPIAVALERLFGLFDGEIRFEDSSRTWQMLFELTGRPESGKLRGDCKLELTDHGTVITKFNQTGELNVIRRFSDDSVGILLAPSDSQYFQIFYIPQRDFFVGNYYTKSRTTNAFSAVGTVRLTRR